MGEAAAQLKRGASALEAMPRHLEPADRARLCKEARVVELRQSLLELRRVALLQPASASGEYPPLSLQADRCYLLLNARCTLASGPQQGEDGAGPL